MAERWNARIRTRPQPRHPTLWLICSNVESDSLCSCTVVRKQQTKVRKPFINVISECLPGESPCLPWGPFPCPWCCRADSVGQESLRLWSQLSPSVDSTDSVPSNCVPDLAFLSKRRILYCANLQAPHTLVLPPCVSPYRHPYKPVWKC